jgi:cell division protein FtsI (penicillin-binding protein 3)
MIQNQWNKRKTSKHPATQVMLQPGRIYAMMIFCLLIVCWVAVRLGDLQIMQHAELSAMAQGEIVKHITIQPDRGLITDSQGNVLAMDVERQTLWVNPTKIAPERATSLALTLASIMDKDVQELLYTFSQHDLQWVRVARWLKPEVAEQIAALQEPGLYLIYEPRRIYPQENFAAHVIGAVNDNGDGISGIESYYNNALKGITGTLQAEFDSQQNPIAIAPQESTPARPGMHLQLTIDPVVQHIAETELEKAVREHSAEAGLVLIMEPETGAIRALATWPSFDPNRYGDYPSEIYGRNPAISNLYEPGSTFKMVTVAAGLQSRSFTADTQVSDPGVINRFDVRIHNWNSLGNGMIDPADMLYYSSNVGAVQFNEMTGAEHFYPLVEKFGFGSLTGIDMGGEESGIVHDHTSPSYNEILLRSNAYGQGIAVTPLQMVQAAAVIANDGVMMQPYVVARRCWKPDQQATEQPDESQEHIARTATPPLSDEEQVCETTRPTKVGEVIEPGVAWTIRRMLVHSANHYAPIVWGGYADQWLVPGYEVCAKTGTASIPLPEGGYDPYNVIGSVLGFAPAEDARYVVLVKIDRPKRDAWGLATSVPVFHHVVRQLMHYERIEPNPQLVSPGQM